MTPSERAVTVTSFAGEVGERREDCLAVEEPLEIRLGCGPLTKRMRRQLTVTLRTPGHDEELAFGLLFSEGIIDDIGDVIGIERGRRKMSLRVDLAPHVK